VAGLDRRRRGATTTSAVVAMTNSPAPDGVHRTAKQLFESGQASSLPEAEEILQRLVLQVDVGADIERTPSAQATLMTVVNAGARAFRGGVHVRTDDDPLLSEGWGAGASMSSMIARLGGRLTAELDSTHPTVVIGAPTREPPGSAVMHAICSGWAGGVVQDPSEVPRESGITLAGVIAGGLAVSEAFQHCGGSPEAARRDVGISLWRPDVDWRADEARGPRLAYLPSALWLLGLGHLGQGYAWSLGMLPYGTPAEVLVCLVDTDSVIAGNLATGLLSHDPDVTRRKTRVVANSLEQLGFSTAIVERPFDENTWPTEQEPAVALAGFDSPIPRRQLGDGRFERVIDAGLGTGAVEYLDMLIHAFPSQLNPKNAFQADNPSQRPLTERYEREIQRLVAEGAAQADAECGMTEIAGISVAAAFVGSVAGALAVSDLLRLLHSGLDAALLQLDLRTPNMITVLENTAPSEFTNPGFTCVRE
jgi:hypothetical protein